MLVKGDPYYLRLMAQDQRYEFAGRSVIVHANLSQW